MKVYLIDTKIVRNASDVTDVAVKVATIDARDVDSESSESCRICERKAGLRSTALYQIHVEGNE